MKTFIVELAVVVEDEINESNLSSVIVEAIDENEHCQKYIKEYSLTINQ